MTPTPNEWFFPRGSLARAGWTAVVDSGLPGWRHTGLHLADLAPDDGYHGARSLPADDTERLIIPLAGTFTVQHTVGPTRLTGRTSVFDGPADSLYLGAGTDLTITGTGRVAVASAVVDPGAPRLSARHLAAGAVPVEIRGAGRDTRQVHNLGTPESLAAQSLIVCEVITPAGNWSSHPAHKHDEERPGHETRLEEIYYFEAAPHRGLTGCPEPVDAFGSFVTYSSPAGEIDTNALVRTGDIALVPYGFHGPAAAPPEYDLYYLNVMAGSERDWLITDDPAQAWLRQTWAAQQPDPRLPYRSEGAPR